MALEQRVMCDNIFPHRKIVLGFEDRAENTTKKWNKIHRTVLDYMMGKTVFESEYFSRTIGFIFLLANSVCSF